MSVWKEQQSDVKGIKKRLPHGFDFATQNLGKRSSKMKEDWKECKLGEVVEINPTESIKKGAIAKKIGMDILQPYCRSISSFSTEAYSGGAKFRNKDTIMARITPCLENGKTAMVGILDDNEIGFGSTEYIVFRAKDNISDPYFIYYLITSSIIREPAIKSMVGSSGRQRVQTDVVTNLSITLPPLATQQKIAAILSSLDDKIELNNKINDNLEQQAQAIFKSWFVDFEPFGGKMPEGWKVGKLSEIGTIVGGSTPSKARKEYYTNKGIAWITPKDLSNDKSKFISHGEIDITELGFKNSSAIKMPKGTVLYSSRAPIGYIAISKNEVTTNQGFKSVIPNPNVGNAYIYYFLRSNFELIDNMASGSTFKEISGTAMKNVPVLIPDDKTLYNFQTMCETLFSQQELLENENRNLSAIRDTLLPKLMNGEIEIL